MPRVVIESPSFWGVLANELLLLCCIDVACPAEVTAIAANGDRYHIKLGEYAMQPDIISLSEVQLPTRKL
jgi:hypothetical protein